MYDMYAMSMRCVGFASCACVQLWSFKAMSFLHPLNGIALKEYTP